MTNAQTIVDYWFGDVAKPRWFDSTEEFDARLKERFLPVYQQAARGELANWESEPVGCLALVILLDQIPLNIFRGTAKAFATETMSREVAQRAIAGGLDAPLSKAQKAFLYMPYMHSESLTDQTRAIELFEQAGLDDNLKFAHHHRAIVERFGRFPHRNAILDRQSSAEEKAWLASDEAFTG